jgi:hypothetical protein
VTRALAFARDGRVLCGIAAFAVPLAVYAASASHQPASWDTAEFQGVPYILGITHPTGFPLFVLLGYAWSHLAIIGSIAFRMNVFSAVTIAVAAVAAYAVALEFGAAPLVALLVTFWYALTPDVWSHAIRAEAQDLAVACEALAIYAFVRWMKEANDVWFLAAFALYGLGMAAHPNAIWLLPAFVAGAFAVKHRPSLRLSAGAFALTALGLAFYLYLPLRSSYIVAHGLDPTLALGTDGGIFWNYHDPSTPRGLLLDLTGSESHAPGYFLASFDPVHLQAALWAFVKGVGEQFGAFMLVLVFAGAAAAWRRDWRTTLVLCMACTAALLFSVTYSGEGDVGRYRLLALWLAVPLVAALVPRSLNGARAAFARSAMAIFLLAGTGFAFAASRTFFDHNANEGGRWVIDAVRPYVPPGGVIMVDWLDATSLAYGAYVDGSLPGRIIVSGWDAAKMPEYRKWAKTHPVFLLVNPQNTGQVPGTTEAAHLDDYHELLKVRPS